MTLTYPQYHSNPRELVMEVQRTIDKYLDGDDEIIRTPQFFNRCRTLFRFYIVNQRIGIDMQTLNETVELLATDFVVSHVPNYKKKKKIMYNVAYLIEKLIKYHFLNQDRKKYMNYTGRLDALDRAMCSLSDIENYGEINIYDTKEFMLQYTDVETYVEFSVEKKRIETQLNKDLDFLSNYLTARAKHLAFKESYLLMSDENFFTENRFAEFFKARGFVKISLNKFRREYIPLLEKMNFFEV